MPKYLAAFAIILATVLLVIARVPVGTLSSRASASSGGAPAATIAAVPQSATGVPSAKHTITVKFDYDFSRSPACSASVTKKCVQQFNVYDISGGMPNKFKLFSIPVPPGAKGKVTGITGTSPQLAFEPGQHFLGVTAQPPSGDESSPLACQMSVQINP